MELLFLLKISFSKQIPKFPLYYVVSLLFWVTSLCSQVLVPREDSVHPKVESSSSEGDPDDLHALQRASERSQQVSESGMRQKQNSKATWKLWMKDSASTLWWMEKQHRSKIGLKLRIKWQKLQMRWQRRQTFAANREVGFMNMALSSCTQKHFPCEGPNIPISIYSQI